jgi:IS30 family transposase
MSYQHLTYENRIEIKAYLSCGMNQAQIARKLGVHKSTISRELKRNKGQKGYRPKQAHKRAQQRQRQAAKHVRFTADVKQRVIHYLRLHWSPEQIAGYLRVNENIFISHETIYQFIWQNKKNGGDLYLYLRHASKKRKKRYGKKDHRGQIKDRISIDQRPQIVDEKERIGDWEIDTIIGKNHKGALVSAVERKSQYTCISHVPRREAELVAEAIVEMLSPYKDQVFTITIDNGKEFSLHKTIAEKLKAKVFFAHPYCAWERGLNEQVNGLIRQYFPKKTDLSVVTEQQLHFVQTRLNQRPRKLLDFKSPAEVFLYESVALET